MAPRRRQSYGGNLKRLSKKKNTHASSNYASWQSALPSPIDRLSALYRFGKLTDLTITFPGHKDILKVHRLVLAMSSPVFECMLFGPMAEGGELKLPEDPPQAFKWLIKYVYCAATKLPRVSTAVQVYHLASKYQMKALSTLCSKYLEENLNGSNFPVIFDTASLHADKALLKACADVVSKEAESVLTSSDIGELSRQSLKHFLQQDMQVKSEVLVFNGIVNWGKTHGSHPMESFEGGRTVREEIEEFLPHIRFLTLTLEEFVEHVIPANILTDAECTSILMNIMKVKKVPLPTACSVIKEKRYIFDWECMHRVFLFQRSYYHYNGLSGTIRHQIITNMHVSKEIYIDGITLSSSHDLYNQTWKLEICKSSKAVLGVAENTEPDDESPKLISAIFDPPVLLKSNEAYDIWVTCNKQQKNSYDISVPYDNLTITGSMWGRSISIEIDFFCFDDTLKQKHCLKDNMQL